MLFNLFHILSREDWEALLVNITPGGAKPANIAKKNTHNGATLKGKNRGKNWFLLKPPLTEPKYNNPKKG